MSEHSEQVAFFDWVKWQANADPRFLNILAIPNAAKRSWLTGKAMKQEGLSAGFPDIAILIPTRSFAGAFLELKVGKNRPTQDQRVWLQRLRRQGYAAAVLWGADAAIDWTVQYLKADGATAHNAKDLQEPQEDRDNNYHV